METTFEKPKAQHKTISIKRTFNLPVELVWNAWTKPEIYKKWWGPYDYTCPFCTIDLRIGGKYLSSMKGKDGNEMFGTGIYKEIIPGKKLVMTDNFADSNGKIIPAPENMPGDWSKELLVTVEIEAQNGKTNLFLKYEGLPAEAFDECTKGWQQSLDKLESNLY